jgi:hypothetical protein
LSMRILALSVEEDWISGVTVVPVNYSKPYASLEPFFPPNSKKYVASKVSKEQNQPYRAIPWVAKFSGCCSQFQALKAGVVKSWDFELISHVDLSDNIASPRIIAMPQVWLQKNPPNEKTRVTFCAISVAGPPGMLRRSYGTINYPDDDNRHGTMDWTVISGTGREEWEPLPASSSTNCRTLLIRNSETEFVTPDESDSAAMNAPWPNSVTVGSSVGTDCARGACNLATAHVQLLLMKSADSGKAPVASSAFECARPAGRLLAVRGLPLNASTDFTTACLDLSFAYGAAAAGDAARQSLEVRYVVGSAGAQTPQLSTAPGRVNYSLAAGAEDHAGLPSTARMSAGYGVQDVQVPPRPTRFAAPPSPASAAVERSSTSSAWSAELLRPYRRREAQRQPGQRAAGRAVRSPTVGGHSGPRLASSPARRPPPRPPSAVELACCAAIGQQLAREAVTESATCRRPDAGSRDSDRRHFFMAAVEGADGPAVLLSPPLPSIAAPTPLTSPRQSGKVA